MGSPSPLLRMLSDSSFVFLSQSMQFSPGHMLKIDADGNPVWKTLLMMMPTDIIEVADKGLIVIGNGPLLGVKMSPTLNPQIGIIKTDSAGTNSSQCVIPESTSSSANTFNLVPMTYTATTGCNPRTMHPVITNASLSIDTGCVAMTGGVLERSAGEFSVKIHPNPSGGIVHLELKLPSRNCSIRVYNTLGDLVYLSDNENIIQREIDLSSRPDGIYYIQVISGGKLFSKNFIISHQ
jgi:hypothetical protein